MSDEHEWDFTDICGLASYEFPVAAAPVPAPVVATETRDMPRNIERAVYRAIRETAGRSDGKAAITLNNPTPKEITLTITIPSFRYGWESIGEIFITEDVFDTRRVNRRAASEFLAEFERLFYAA